MIISKDNSISCDSLESYLHLILKSKVSPKNNTHIYFRGESKYHRYIIPNLYMHEELTGISSENYYRTMFSKLGKSDYSNGADLFRDISEFQHYGAKTRILDITSNPLIALYFAVEKYYGESCRCRSGKVLEEPGYVYIYGSHIKTDKYDRTAEQFDVGHTVAIKSALNLLPQDWINRFLADCDYIKNNIDDDWESFKIVQMNDIPNNEFSPKTKQVFLDKYGEIYRFMDMLNQRAKTNERLIYPFVIYEDLCISHIVIPSKCTDRIKQQQGAFIFPKYVNTEFKSMDEISEEIDNSISTLLNKLITEDGKEFAVIEIPASKKLEIKKDLAKIGITEGFVYPEIEHLSNSLLYGY